MCTESGMILFKVHCNNITDTDSLNHLVLLFFFITKFSSKFLLLLIQLLNDCSMHTSGWNHMSRKIRPQFVWLV